MKQSLYVATTEALYQLAALLDNGLSAPDALHIVQQDEAHVGLRHWLQRLAQLTQEGHSLNAALQQQPGALEPFIIGRLAEIPPDKLSTFLTQAVAYREQQDAIGLRRHVLSHLFYPALLLVFLVGFLGLMLTMVMPAYLDLFAGVNVDLPLVTQTLIHAGDYLWLIPLLVVALSVLMIWIAQQQGARSGRMALNFPLLGYLQQQIVLVRFLRTAAFLLTDNPQVPSDLMQQATAATRNGWYQAIGAKLVDTPTSQTALADQLAAHPHAFPAKICQAVRTGSQVNPSQFADLFTRLADSYTRQVQLAIDPAFKALNLIIAIIYGVVIGFVLLGLYIPLFSLGQAI